MIQKYAIIAGVHKAGTTSLFTHLSQHPQINFSKIKETHYFSSHLELPNEFYDSRVVKNSYEKFFSIKKSSNLFLEASPEYIYSGKQTINSIFNELGKNVKLIFILRNPIEQIYSQFRHKKHSLYIDSSISFDKYLEDISLHNQNYHKHLLKWYEKFDDENIKIIFFDDFKKNQLDVFIDICEYLNIDKQFFNKKKLSIENKTEEYKIKFLHKMALRFAKNFEFFLRKNHTLKKKLRSLYRLFNIKKNSQLVDLTKYSKINKTLNIYNSKLKILLEEKGYFNYPSWVK